MSQQLELLTESPAQWTTVSLLTPEIQKKEIKPFVILALKELEGNPDSRTSSLMNADKFSAVREVVRHFARLRSATKDAWHLDDVQTFLEGLRFSPDCVAELTSLLCMDQMYSNIPTHLRVKPGLLSLQWKIDVSLSQSTQQRNKESLQRTTYVILTIKLTDGQTNTYRLSIDKFQALRYSVASALKSMIVLERRNCMRKY
ncbi:COMM domain containing 5 Like Sm protein 4 [Anticarsia gemmatalis]|uniref:COMM domain containing 5 Like Sm protein 4 n=1 Tax=Anticarsia gemmatalis TaxID=129554 RepID=UPI003F764080